MIYSNQLEANVYNIAQAPFKSLGYDIVRIRLQQDKAKRVLQIMIERLDQSTVNIDDCEKASNYISVLLDVEDPIKGEYNLEISSPGLERPLTRPKDFIMNVGKSIRLQTKLPINGQKRFKGVLKEFEDQNKIVLEQFDTKEIIEVDFENISEATLDILPELEDKKGKKKNLNKKKQILNK